MTSKSVYDFSKTFERRFQSKNPHNDHKKEAFSKKDEKTDNFLEDVCDICFQYTPNIIVHLKSCHPEVYKEMMLLLA